MTLNEFFSIITKDKYIEPYIVALKYKFDFEDKYTIANEYLDVDMDMPIHPYYPFEWLNDWNEGQTDIEVLGFKKISEVRITNENDRLEAEIKKSVSMRENLSYIQNMCSNNSTCDGCPFENGNCYFYNVPTKWNIDDIMKMLEIAGSEVSDGDND